MFLKERDLAVDTNGSKQWRYKPRNEILTLDEAILSVDVYKGREICVPHNGQGWQEYARW